MRKNSFFERSHPAVPAPGPVVLMGVLAIAIIVGTTALANFLIGA